MTKTFTQKMQEDAREEFKKIPYQNANEQLDWLDSLVARIVRETREAVLEEILEKSKKSIESLETYDTGEFGSGYYNGTNDALEAVLTHITSLKKTV